MHSTAADKVDVRRRDGDVSVVWSGAGKVLGTLALSTAEGAELYAALGRALGVSPPSSSETDG